MIPLWLRYYWIIRWLVTIPKECTAAIIPLEKQYNLILTIPALLITTDFLSDENYHHDKLILISFIISFSTCNIILLNYGYPSITLMAAEISSFLNSQRQIGSVYLLGMPQIPKLSELHLTLHKLHIYFCFLTILVNISTVFEREGEIFCY